MDNGTTPWAKWGRLAAPSLFLLAVIYYEELFLKLYCFRSLTAAGAVFTFLFTLPVALAGTGPAAPDYRAGLFVDWRSAGVLPSV